MKNNIVWGEIRLYNVLFSDKEVPQSNKWET